MDELRGEEREAWPGRFLSAADRRTKLRTRNPETDDRSASQHALIATIVASSVKRLLQYQVCVPKDELSQSICANVARLLCEERERQNISLNSLAQRAGISRQTISFIETQERNPTLLTLLRITTVLGVPVEDIIGKARRSVPRSKQR